MNGIGIEDLENIHIWEANMVNFASSLKEIFKENNQDISKKEEKNLE